MAIYNNGTTSFVWNGKRYGVGSRVKFKDEFVKTFTWMGENICDQGIFLNVYISGGVKMFQFRKYCPEEFLSNHTYPGCFSFTELELLNAIESILRPVLIEEVTAAKPPFAEKQLGDTHQGRCRFFELDGRYYGQGSKIYLNDEFILKYKEQTGYDLTKKVAFLCSEMHDGKREYHIASCNDMKIDGVTNYCFYNILTEIEFFESIECIADCHTIKYKDKDEPTIFIFWIIYILLIILSFIVFGKPSAVIVALTIGFFKIRNILLSQ